MLRDTGFFRLPFSALQRVGQMMRLQLTHPCAQHCLSRGQSLTRMHHKKKGAVANSLAVIPDNGGRQNERGGLTFRCMVEQLLAIWVISVETGKCSLFLCQMSPLEPNWFPFASSTNHWQPCQQMQTRAKEFLLIIVIMEIGFNPSWCCLAGEMVSVFPRKGLW